MASARVTEKRKMKQECWAEIRHHPANSGASTYPSLPFPNGPWCQQRNLISYLVT